LPDPYPEPSERQVISNTIIEQVKNTEWNYLGAGRLFRLVTLGASARKPLGRNDIG
jgi:hypothetical protein